MHPSQILGVPSSHPSLGSLHEAVNCGECSMLETYYQQIFCPSKRILVFNILKQPFSIPNVHLTSFLMDSSHFANHMSGKSTVFSTAALSLTNSDNDCQQSAILQHTSVSQHSQCSMIIQLKAHNLKFFAFMQCLENHQNAQQLCCSTWLGDPLLLPEFDICN